MGPAAGDDHIDLSTREGGGKFSKPLVFAVRLLVFDRKVLALNVARLSQPLDEGGDYGCFGRQRGCATNRSPGSSAAVCALSGWCSFL